MEGQYLSGGYMRITLNGKVYNVHRLLWERHNGAIPEGFVIDHIDGNTLNNSLDNLRAIPKGANKANTVSSRGLPKGVYSRQNKQGVVYYGQINMGGRIERRASIKNLQDVVDWAESTHSKMLREIYGITNIRT